MNINKDEIRITAGAARPAAPWAALRRNLAARGGRLTPQRMAIYDAVVGRTTHPSVETVYREVRRRFPGISPATVYATLSLFADLGLVQELSGPVRRYDGQAARHVNLVCRRCGRVTDVADPRVEALERAVSARARFDVRSARFELHGVCARCRRRAERRGGAAGGI